MSVSHSLNGCVNPWSKILNSALINGFYDGGSKWRKGQCKYSFGDMANTIRHIFG